MKPRSEEEILKEAKTRRTEIDNLQEQHFEIKKFQDEVDQQCWEHEKLLEEMSQHMDRNARNAASLDEACYRVGEVKIQNEAGTEEILHEVSSSISMLNEKVENLNVELKASKREQE